MTWLEIALIASNLVTLALALYRIDQLNMRRVTVAALQEAVSRRHRREGGCAHLDSSGPALLRQPASVAIAIARQTLRRIPRPWRKGA